MLWNEYNTQLAEKSIVKYKKIKNNLRYYSN